LKAGAAKEKSMQMSIEIIRRCVPVALAVAMGGQAAEAQNTAGEGPPSVRPRRRNRLLDHF